MNLLCALIGITRAARTHTLTHTQKLHTEERQERKFVPMVEAAHLRHSSPKSPPRHRISGVCVCMCLFINTNYLHTCPFIHHHAYACIRAYSSTDYVNLPVNVSVGVNKKDGGFSKTLIFWSVVACIFVVFQISGVEFWCVSVCG